MFYQLLFGLGVIALVVANRQRQKMPSGGTGFFWLSICAVGYVLTEFYPGSSPVAQGAQIVCFAMIPPLYFCTTKHFTNLALPQWTSLRAFVLGVPLLLGISAAVGQLAQVSGQAATSTSFDSVVLVGYGFGLLSVGVAVWRFVSTPRQRQTLVLLTLLPLALIAAHALELKDFIPATSSALLLAVCIAVASIFNLRIVGSSVRPVPRSALVDQVLDGLVVIDPNHRVVDYNEAAAGWMGDHDRSLVGCAADQVFPERLLPALHSDSTQSITLPWTKGGVDYWFEVHLAPLIVDRQKSGKIVTLRDISRRRRAELALEQSRNDLEAANARLEELANTDALTGLANRRFTLAQLETEIERHRRSGMTLGLLLLDLDHFKRVNDRFGHPMGDRVLVDASRCMEDTARDNDCVGRIGGEEFAILVVDATPEGPEVLAERIRANLASLDIRSEDGDEVPLSASIGCVKYSGGRVDGATLVHLADLALYAAKNAGRNNVKVAAYEPLPNSDYGKRGAEEDTATDVVAHQ